MGAIETPWFLETYPNSHNLNDELVDLLRTVGEADSVSSCSEIVFEGQDPLVAESPYRNGAVSALPPMAVAVLAQHAYFLRTGEKQRLSTDLRRTVYGLSIGWKFNPGIAGHPHSGFMFKGNPFLRTIYNTKDNRKILLCAVYPELRLKWYSFLKVPPYPNEAIADEIAKWDSKKFEDEAAKAGLPCTIIRTREEWLQEEQGQIMARRSPVPIERISDAPVKPLPQILKGARPLEGIKVLMATHAIAGPSAGRALAEHGAHVLQCFHGFEHEVYNEANIGCRSTPIDFNDEEDLAAFWRLVKETDVFIESYRQDSLSKFGITNEKLVEMNPNIIICNTKCYGVVGPWAARAGFDMNACAAVGVMPTSGSAEDPKFPELHLINDFTTGFFGAMGIMAGLIKRATIGGAWRVSPALAQTAMYYEFKLGQFGKDATALAGKTPETTLGKPHVLERDTMKGNLRRLGHPIIMEKTPCRWDDPILFCQGSCLPTFDWD